MAIYMYTIPSPYKKYRCWYCGEEIDASKNILCKECLWFICFNPDCLECGCNYHKHLEPYEDYKERKGFYDIDYDYDQFGHRREL